MYEAVERPLPEPSVEEYVSVRLLEALVEVLSVLELLEGLMGDAVGKAFQAWKTLLAASAAKRREAIDERFKRAVADRRGRADLIVAPMPTTRMGTAAELLAEGICWEAAYLADFASNLRDLQHDGLNPGGLGGRYGRVEAARTSGTRPRGSPSGLSASGRQLGVRSLHGDPFGVSFLLCGGHVGRSISHN